MSTFYILYWKDGGSNKLHMDDSTPYLALLAKDLIIPRLAKVA